LAGKTTVVLSGGCFQNAFLLDALETALEAAGYRVLAARDLPPNDGAIAAGQALGAALSLTTVLPPISADLSAEPSAAYAR
jgi:hydrogenase maturation protein HypF